MTTAIGSTLPSTASSSASGIPGTATSASGSSLPISASAGTALPTTGLITSAGIGSGLNVDAIVSQLVASAAAPENAQIQAKQASIGNEITAINSLQSALTTFQTAVQGLATTSAFTAFTASSSNPQIFTASAASTATPGTYSVQVNKLAQGEQLASAALAGGSSAYVGVGTLTLTQGGTSINLTIDNTDDTLAGIATAINSASGNPGINASVVNTSSGAVLFLTSASTGAASAITVTSAGGDGGLGQLDYPQTAGGTGPSGMQGLTQAQTPQDADVTLAGLDVTSATNTLSDALPGLTLNLVAVSPSSTSGGITTTTPQTLTIENDTTTTTNQVNAFVSAYNTLQTTIASLGAYNAGTGVAGPLLGDPLLSNLKNEITGDLYATVPGLTTALNSLASIGITPDSSGQLQVDSATLQSALTSNYNAVGQIFGGTNGVAATLNTTLSNALGATGSLQSRTTTLNQELTQSQSQQSQLEQQMAVLQSTYLSEFTALDTLLANFQSTASFLTTQLAGFNTSALTNYNS